MKSLLSLLCALALLVNVRAAFHADIEYGTADGESLRLDAYVPEGDGPFPAVILVHGGGWSGGDKSGGNNKGFIAPLQDPLTKAGFAWFTINYRLAPKHPHPAAVEDVETAIRWVKQHAAEYRVDPKRIALAGESAGGHLVALAAVRADDRTRVAAVIPIYTPFDLRVQTPSGQPLGKIMADFTGQTVMDDRTRTILEKASPLLQVRAGLPPFLLLHGDADNRVPYDQSLRFAARLREVGVPVELITIKGGSHGMLGWDALAPDFKVRLVAWLKKTLGEPRRAPPAS